MYAHHVIEDLYRACTDWLNINEDGKQLFPEIADLIKQTQQFYLGDLNNTTILHSYHGKQLFDDPHIETIRLPYPTVWLDWQDHRKNHLPKAGMLITTQAENDYGCFCFAEITPALDPTLIQKRWVLYPLSCSVHYSDSFHNFLVHTMELEFFKKY